MAKNKLLAKRYGPDDNDADDAPTRPAPVVDLSHLHHDPAAAAALAADGLDPVLPPPSEAERIKAMRMYWRGYTVSDIARHFDKPTSTLYSWKERDGWDTATVVQRAASHMDVRLCMLMAKDKKSHQDYAEINHITDQLLKLARIERFAFDGKESSVNTKKLGNKIERRATPNTVTDEQISAMQAAMLDSLFGYQKTWLTAKQQRLRSILKSRQIGATWYFAREAFLDALLTGDNQIFLSASRAQAEVFRGYIIDFARQFDVELKGNPIVLGNSQGGGDGATLYFLSTSSRTAQSYHGHVYFDEIFWVPKFKELRKVASGMAMHKKWRQTYFSTPSAITHEAYPFWAGKGKKRADGSEGDIDISHSALAAGRVCSDGMWRQIVTVLDAQASGCTLFDVEQLRLEYTPEEFEQLLMCKFIDDTMSVFGFGELMACGVDSLIDWPDYVRSAPRPIGHREVWVGYDPSRTRDNAAVVVLAPAQAKGAPYRVLEKHEWRGMDFVAQAQAIQRITQRYNVRHMSIDTTGVGYGVFDIVRGFYPAAQAVNYSPTVKSRLVLRAKELVRSRRLHWDSGWHDVMRAFLSIMRVPTSSGSAITYEAARNDQSGHADLAWAIMHALEGLPFNQVSETLHGSTSFMQLS